MSIMSSVLKMVDCFLAKEKEGSLSAFIEATGSLHLGVARLLKERTLLASAVSGKIDPDSEEGKAVKDLAAEILSKVEA